MENTNTTQAEQFFIIDRENKQAVPELFDTVAEAVAYAEREFSYMWEYSHFISTNYNPFA